MHAQSRTHVFTKRYSLGLVDTYFKICDLFLSFPRS